MPHAAARHIGALIVSALLFTAVPVSAAPATSLRSDALASDPVRSQATQWNGSYNLYREGVFVTQYTWTWCVGASTQAMLNIIKGTSNTTKRRQKKLVTHAMNNDEHEASTGGSDAVGWARALTHFGGGEYRPVMSTSYRQAVRRAVRQMRLTGKPIGLLVMGGRHAWVLNGFSATADPARTKNFEVTNVFVMGPLYPKQQKGWYDMPPNTRLTWRQFKKPFRVFDDPDSPRMMGYWVTVNPVYSGG